MLREHQLKKLLKQKLDVLKFPSELKMFCRDCQNSLTDVLQKYRALETAHASLVIENTNLTSAFNLAKTEAKSWEQTYMDLTEVVQESHAVLEILRVENQLNAQIIEEWEERRRGQYDNI